MTKIRAAVSEAVLRLKSMEAGQNYYEPRWSKNDVGDLARFMFLEFTSAGLLEWSPRYDGDHGSIREFNLFPHNKMDRFWLKTMLRDKVQAYGDRSGYKLSYAFLADDEDHNAYEPRTYQPESEAALCYSTRTDDQIADFDFGTTDEEFEENVGAFLNHWRQKEYKIVDILDKKLQEGVTRYEKGWSSDERKPVSYWQGSCGRRN